MPSPQITGVSHVDLSVPDLDNWLARLDELDIPHSGLTEQPNWDVLVLRDPDNVQLELIHIKPGVIEMLSPSE
ncbi:MAG TPA: hypothetical protein VMY16_06985 [Ilumatobacteraceae bacterium]|nr:hypothetical protein [Ilumatobacteraceae bacterium]